MHTDVIYSYKHLVTPDNFARMISRSFGNFHQGGVGSLHSYTLHGDEVWVVWLLRFTVHSRYREDKKKSINFKRDFPRLPCRLTICFWGIPSPRALFQTVPFVIQAFQKPLCAVFLFFGRQDINKEGIPAPHACHFDCNISIDLFDKAEEHC